MLVEVDDVVCLVSLSVCLVFVSVDFGDVLWRVRVWVRFVFVWVS